MRNSRLSLSLAVAFVSGLLWSSMPTSTLAQKQNSESPNATPAQSVEPVVDIPPPPSEQADVSEINFGAIVRVEVDTKQPNYRVPWNIGGMGNGVGTGFLVGDNRFVTNAHVVSNNRLIYIKKTNDPRPYKARVVNVAHDCDLALLEIENSTEFKTAFSGVEPLVIGDIPKLNTTVIAVGYPIGGERISVTRGVVSRIDFRPYSHSGVDFHLTIQVDAAINPGNSGGPVLQDNKVVGVAFQGYSGAVAQNTGYMIPVPVVERFLKDTADGTYDHYVDLATQTLNVLNPAQRIALSLPNDDVGVMVTEADPAGPAGSILKTGDVLLSIDGHVIASDGFIEIEGERVNLNEIIERKFAGDMVALEIWRDGARQDLKIELERFLPYLIQANTYDKQPDFVLFAGLQFQPLDRNLMAAHNISDLQVRYFYSYYSSEGLYRERPEVIILTAVLPDSANTYLQPYVHKVIDTINGKKIRVLQDVWDALHGDFSEKGHEDFHVIRCLGEGRPLVMERATAREAHDRIMAKYNVNFDNHIEVPEILSVEGLFDDIDDDASDKDDTKEKKQEKSAKSAPEAIKSASAR
ncbi:MAG: trypsin-like peptidase domain-containing protein [Verrucomicrobiae bacterium]|nr:trypsin-like peptidase domain-containing protein [Verrucomicrobiae bacterium]